MSLRLFDTGTQSVRDFVPLVEGEVGVYLCGATVQSPPHVGHVRSAVAFDVLVRWLRRSGARVTMVRNVTDIDDKILAKAAAAGRPWWAWALQNERAFASAYAALGVLPPDYEPRATGHVPAMLELMDRLVERGHAYAAGPGDVYFDVRSWAEYGALTNQRVDDMTDVPEDAGSGKRDPHDFALWKAPKPGEPGTAAWQTRYGRGRPGWHLECSAMAHRYLGESFDIHGGGLDLRFPHHENEQAQSRAAGYGFARYWLHNGWVTQGGAKMSKSLGNGLLVTTVLEKAPAVVVRYALTAVQYRSMLEWTDDTLAEAAATWDRLAGFVQRATERVGTASDDEVAGVELPAAFAAALDDDLNVPAALAVVHETLRAGNSALAAGDDAAARAAMVTLRGMLDVLGLDPGSAQWRTAGGDGRHAHALDALVRAELDARSAARAARDWATADAIRDRLTAAGVVVEDSPTGARWTLAAPTPAHDTSED
ncbi:cysteinyl-tRNA synthetase [Cellulomonas flavigena DSM 20109]|uniref:Cysteine--tRNA ligase n=1 Tax=Cellulomonas flavigena (strain ATCC 482 / DSM 20109 / BCRC 11376 / JCM 18109 / NBRC 3775 / NCIMB 8073 / NRS 134) TaxID=446466 RepID=D5UJ60_CELFN|nr:cysteine--tRNA ligase [Cellulomonas flavigena]ADG73583.1 cysteinyl-tRNA synthetase [Cellulomonas flavigena DSM 20109]